MNRMQNENGFDAQITNGELFRLVFRNFQAAITPWSTPACVCIDWKNQNGTSEGAIRYLIDKAAGNVTISGDYGTAIAHWDTELTPEKLYQFTNDVSYFIGKLRCTTDRYEFSPQAANEDLDTIASESRMEGIELQATLDYLKNWFAEHGEPGNISYPVEITTLLNSINPRWSYTKKWIGQRAHGRIGIWAWCYRRAYEQLRNRIELAGLFGCEKEEIR